MSYTKTVWVNGTTPAINATNLNKIEDGLLETHDGTIGFSKFHDVTTTQSLVSFSVTGLDNYRIIKGYLSAQAITTAATVDITFNQDASTLYSYYNHKFYSSQTNAGYSDSDTKIQISNAGGGNNPIRIERHTQVFFEMQNSSNQIKNLTGNLVEHGSTFRIFGGGYSSSTTVSSIQFKASNLSNVSTFATGTRLILFGVR
jgi:hypothetical protein